MTVEEVASSKEGVRGRVLAIHVGTLCDGAEDTSYRGTKKEPTSSFQGTHLLTA